MDPLCEKTPWQSPYAYCGADPVNKIDPDGRKILLVHFKTVNRKGRAEGDVYRSKPSFVKAMEEFGKTTYGKSFIAAFLNPNQKQYGVKGNGKYSDITLRIDEMNLSTGSEMGAFMRTNDAYFSAIENENGLNIVMTIDVKNLSGNQLFETIVHELALHGSKVDAIVSAYKKGGIKAVDKLMIELAQADTDHKALKEKDLNNRSYRAYFQTMYEYCMNNY